MDDSTTVAGMPVWLSDSNIDPAWIHEKLPNFQGFARCEAQDISNDTRKGATPKDGATLLLKLIPKDDTDRITTVVAKQVPPNGLALSRMLGLAREALFYNTLAPKVKLSKKSSDQSCDKADSCIPKIYYSSGGMIDGSKFVIMEDLSTRFVDSGILFGPGNPNNWKRDLDRKIAQAYPSVAPTSYEVANQTFLAIANVHATFWRDQTLLTDEYSWLRGSSWIRGNDEASWRASQTMIQSMWEQYLQDPKNENEGIRWDALVRQIVEKAIEGISWESQRKRLSKTTHFCLVHGDFWPGNIMISKGDGDRDLRLLDWEMVGEYLSSKVESSCFVHSLRTNLIRCFPFSFSSCQSIKHKYKVLEVDHKIWDNTFFPIWIPTKDESAKKNSFETTITNLQSSSVFLA